MATNIFIVLPNGSRKTNLSTDTLLCKHGLMIFSICYLCIPCTLLLSRTILRRSNKNSSLYQKHSLVFHLENHSMIAPKNF
jgi:hypothetical protein